MSRTPVMPGDVSGAQAEAPALAPSPELSRAPSHRPKPRPGHLRTSAATQQLLDRCLRWREQAREWLASYRGVAYGISLGLHITLLLVASLLIVQSMADGQGQGDGPGLFGQMGGDGGDLELFDSIDTRLEGPGAGVETIELPQLASVPEVSAAAASPTGLLADIGGLSPKPAGALIDTDAVAGGGGRFGGGGPGGLPFQMPGGGKAIVKGSFTVWTVPDDPEPYQDYLIIIQVRLPKKTREYARDDLSGLVVGTDTYEQTLPGFGFPRGRLLPVKDDVAQLAVPVPGAERLVKDTITVESKLLKEKQKIEIVF
jgi:hypothetical protein